jgi:hypothetical protein
VPSAAADGGEPNPDSTGTPVDFVAARSAALVTADGRRERAEAAAAAAEAAARAARRRAEGLEAEGAGLMREYDSWVGSITGARGGGGGDAHPPTHRPGGTLVGQLSPEARPGAGAAGAAQHKAAAAVAPHVQPLASERLLRAAGGGGGGRRSPDTELARVERRLEGLLAARGRGGGGDGGLGDAQ